MKTLDEFFFRCVAGPNDCIVWVGGLNTHGYGQTYWTDGKGNWSRGKGCHRIAYEHFKGPIPKGFHVDHLCRNRRCVNPNHLEAVTSHENTVVRGQGNPATENYFKTHCLRGHEFTPENTLLSGGHRNCRTCIRIRREQNRDAIRAYYRQWYAKNGRKKSA